MAEQTGWERAVLEVLTAAQEPRTVIELVFLTGGPIYIVEKALVALEAAGTARRTGESASEFPGGDPQPLWEAVP